MQLLRYVTIGQYVPGTSLAHRLDPRCKCLLMAIGLVASFRLCTPPGILLLLGSLLVVVHTSRLSVRFVLRGVRTLTPLLVLSAAFTATAPHKGPALLALGSVRLTASGLDEAAVVCLRLITLVVLTSLLTLSTSPIRLTDAVEQLLRPLRLVGVPTAELAMMMSIALRFIPTLVETTERLLKAQLARGAPFHRGSPLQRLHALVPVLVPLCVQAFPSAEDLAVAMEARCYRGGDRRTRLVQLRIVRADVVASCLALLWLGLVIAADSLAASRIPWMHGAA